MTSEDLGLVQLIVTGVLLLLTLLVYVYQYRAMSRQATIAREASRAQNLAFAIGLLEEPEARRARWWVMRKLTGVPLAEWQGQDTFHASRACARYDLLGMLARLEVVPTDVLAVSWAPSICRVYEVTAEFRRALKLKNGEVYWENFDWLYGRARETWHRPVDSKVDDEVLVVAPESEHRSSLDLPSGAVRIELPSLLTDGEVEQVSSWVRLVAEGLGDKEGRSRDS